ncbi:MAG: hypothetical protein IJN44_12205 [Clostridia bacterium]|nr:hypothetical protein [Clostridia bacterium]
MKKSTLIMILSLVLAVALGVGGTLAYLQDTDEDVNVMTLGNVYIEQHEYERVTDENGDPVKGVEGTDFDADYGIEESYKLKEFTQGKPAYPAVYQEGKMDWDEFQQLWNQVGAPGSNDLFDPSMKNVVDKFVFVENTGKSDAYYRTIIAIEDPEGLSLDATTIHTSFNANSRFDYNSDKDGVQNAADSNKFYTVIDGTRYLVYVATYQEALTPDEVSRPSLLQLYLDPKATNDDVALFGETWDVLVVSQAVQTQGFADAQTALDTAFGPITADNNPWKKDGKDLDDTPVFPVNASGADEMMAGLAEGADIIADKNLDGELIYESNAAIELDAKGATVQLNGAAYDGNTKAYSYFGLVPPAGEDVTLSNLNVTGTGFVEIGHYGQGGGDYTITNLKIVNLASTLATGNNGNVLGSAFCQYGNAVLKDCVMTGTTAADPAATPYDACFINSTNTLVDGGKYGKVYVFEHGKVTFTGAEIDVIDSYARGTSGELVIGNGAKVNTVNIKRTDDNVALTIESGATVGTINYNDTAYTQAEWLAR